MLKKKVVNIPLNRVEGDLEIRAQIEKGIVTDAWCSGTMYRGFEKILVGRGPLDGLVITPRICGICTTSHLTAASKALDMIADVTPPPDAIRMRNLALMVEEIQSDMRHSFLMFAVDFVNPVYKDLKLYPEAMRRYEPFKGKTVIEAVKETKKVLEIIAIIGGQWPHSSYMVPGGIVSVPSVSDLMQCDIILKQYRNWYERRILGCSIQRWQQVKSRDDLWTWLEESESHKESELGFFIRFAKEIGLDKIGKSHDNFISVGAFDLPEGTTITGKRGQKRLIPSGFYRNRKYKKFDQNNISEHVAHSWFVDYEGGKHPFEGETNPYATGQEGKKYSWAKAPRYAELPAETSSLAQMVMAEHPLFLNFVDKEGSNVFVRQLSRLVRPAELIPAMETWINETTGDGNFYVSPGKIHEGEGFGLTEVTRGAVGHWVRIKDGAIDHYQIISPTSWNCSPRDFNDIRGPVEEALVGTEIKDESNPVELGHIVRSYDACLVCTVHTISKNQQLGRLTIGV